MAGTHSGGRKAAEANKKNHGSDFYAKIGSKGGSKQRPESRMFFKNRELARIAGAKGGRKSRKNKNKENTNVQE